MKSKTVAFLLSELGVTKTHSRPHVSNDNPFSEAQFKTMKSRPSADWPCSRRAPREAVRILHRTTASSKACPMNSRIPDGSWCLWRLHRGGEDRLGKVVLAELVLVL